MLENLKLAMKVLEDLLLVFLFLVTIVYLVALQCAGAVVLTCLWMCLEVSVIARGYINEKS